MSPGTSVAGYTRISRVGGRSGDGFISEADQREGISRRASDLGLTVAEWFHDPDYSGGNLRRPEWERLMGRVLNPLDPVKGVVVVRVDRFARTVPEGAPEVQRIWNAGGVFVAADLPVDTTTDHGRKMLWDWLSNAEFQLEMIKTGWSRAKTRAIRRGAHIGRTPFGYTRTPKGGEGSGRLIPHEVNADAVRRAFEGRRDGLSYSEIARLLDRITPKPASCWAIADVRRLLHNRVYLGEIRYGADLVNRASHPPIVDSGLFAAVQVTHTYGRYPRTGTQFLLSGIVRCAHCRYAMAGSAEANRNRSGIPNPVYRCVSRGGMAHQRPGVKAEALEEYVTSVFRDEAQGYADALARGIDSADPVRLDSEVAALWAEVDSWTDDATLRTRLGVGRWQRGLDARLEAAESKQAERDAAHEAAETVDAHRFDPATTDHDELRAALPALVKVVFVRRGRMPVEDRALVVLADGPDFAKPGRGVAGPFPPLPWAVDPSVSRLRVLADPSQSVHRPVDPAPGP